jgi:hypothetical protein
VVVERQAERYQGGGEVTSVAAGDGRWTDAWTTIVGGLAVFVVLGLVGSVPEEGPLQDLLHAVSSIGLTVAAALLALREARRGADLVAAGFAIFAVAEIIIWVGGGTAGPTSEAPLAAATLFYVPALLLISAPSRFALWARAAGALAAVPFGIHAVVFVLGGNSAEILEIAGYLLLSVAVVGWVTDVVRSTRAADGRRVR